MPFNIALSGIRAASSELEITGNNIANASTTGFKESRAEFGDVYATSVLGAGANQIGAGVEIQDTAQQFTQGNITFTNSTLDLAVNGVGFFILNDDEGLSYTRSGAFGLDSDGFITSNNGARLQGYSADASGNVEPVISDLQLETNILDPRQTTGVNQSFNLNATEEVLLSNGQEFETLGALMGLALSGTDNGYPSQSFNIDDPEGGTLTYTSLANETAASIAADLNSVVGLDASAQTSATLSNLNAGGSPLTITLNGIDLVGETLTEIETQINQLTNSSLPGVSAQLDDTTGDLVVNSTVGTDFYISVTGNAGAAIDVQGAQGAAQQLVVGGAEDVTVGGRVSIVVEDGYEVNSFVPNDGSELFEAEASITYTDVVVNGFDATDPETYNAATSTTIYDSLGVAHVMTQYFVKQPYNPSDATSSVNHWQMHVVIDGENVGNPDPAADDPTAATVATYDIYYNPNGTLDEDRTNEFLISNWTPIADSSLAAQPSGPNPAGTIPIEDPPQFSNFVIEIDGSTQFGTTFTVNSVAQDGYTTGQLSGVSIDESGLIFARFTNGESLTLGQVLLADFANQQGLQPLGSTTWTQTFESGEPITNEPGTGSLGAIQAGALEESNVNLSEQLVALIIAQRNFQASAKTIETADQTTQTIINLR